MEHFLRLALLVSCSTCVGCSSAISADDLTIVAEQPICGGAVVAAVGDWPWWRGPAGDGVGQNADVPTTWGADENIRWKAAVPGRGHSSPSVSGSRIFLTTADEDTKKQILLCYDRNSGRELWSKVVHEGGFYKIHPKNSYASSSPACDGEHVYAVFVNNGLLWVTAYDLEGNRAWQTEAGPFESEHGYGPSPTFYKSAIIVAGESLGPGFVAALGRTSGKILWRTPREGTGRHGNYASPIVANVAGREQLLQPGFHHTTSFDPETGKVLWTTEGPTEVAANTASFNDSLVFSSGGFPEKEIMALRADGNGDVSDTHVVWRTNKGVAYVPSPLYHEGYLNVVSDGGIATCYQAETGEQLWQERLDGKFTASLVLAGDRLLITNEKGVTFVLKTGPDFEILAENDLGSGGFATAAVCGNEIYLRTGDSLVCVSDTSKQAAALEKSLTR